MLSGAHKLVLETICSVGILSTCTESYYAKNILVILNKDTRHKSKITGDIVDKITYVSFEQNKNKNKMIKKSNVSYRKHLIL